MPVGGNRDNLASFVVHFVGVEWLVGAWGNAENLEAIVLRSRLGHTIHAGINVAADYLIVLVQWWLVVSPSSQAVGKEFMLNDQLQ